jgi:malate/lactate dehydrogenase
MDKLQCGDLSTLIPHADIIILAFGISIPGQSVLRSDVIFDHDRITKQIATRLRSCIKPNAIILNLVNPLDVITWRFQEMTGLDPRRVIGLSGMHDTARLLEAIVEVLGINPREIPPETLLVCGEHGPHMVPILSRCMVAGTPLVNLASANQLLEINEMTTNKGIDILKLSGGKPPVFGPSRSVVALCKTLINDQSMTAPCSVWSERFGCYLSLRATITRYGVTEVDTVEFSLDEWKKLDTAALAIRKDFNLVNDLETEEPMHAGYLTS